MTTQAYADRDISGALKEEIFCNYGRYKVFNFLMFYGFFLMTHCWQEMDILTMIWMHFCDHGCIFQTSDAYLARIAIDKMLQIYWPSLIHTHICIINDKIVKQVQNLFGNALSCENILLLIVKTTILRRNKKIRRRKDCFLFSRGSM